MQWPSYPKETRDQWPPIEGDHSEWGGACNQSINIGYSLGEQYNLMRHTHTPPPLSDFLLLSAFSLSSSWNLFFMSFSCRLSFCWALSSTTVSALLCHSMHSSSLPSCPLPPPLTSLKFQGDGTNKSKECSCAGVEEGGEDDDENRVEAVGGWGTGKLIVQGQDGFLWLSYSIYRTEIRSSQIIRWSGVSIEFCVMQGLMNYKF